MSTPNQPKNKTLVSAHKDDGGIQFEYDLAPFALTEDAVSRRKKETAPMVALANGAGIGMHDNTTEIGENENIVAEDGLQPEDFMWVEEVDTGEDDLTKKVEKVRRFAALLKLDGTGRGCNMEPSGTRYFDLRMSKLSTQMFY